MAFTQTAQPYPEWRVIVNALKDREYGTTLMHQEIAALAQLVPRSPRYFQQMQRAKRELLKEWRRELETVPREGYRLIQPDEWHQRMRRGFRLIGYRSRQVLRLGVAAPLTEMSNDQRARVADAFSKAGAVETQRRRITLSTRPSLPMPKADVPKMLRG